MKLSYDEEYRAAICTLGMLARDAQAKLVLIVAQCLSIHLCVHRCVCPRQLESRLCTQAALRVASNVDYQLV